ncbi:hypothetical protein [uncultured Paraglaciecola sp.]|uniref:PP2C family protein-serine/threonine phosphatase n=1 Tax=uncultured Paraglaciecola sp. TaxID=1765024 RepID=UPI0025F7EE73|nr:hypothetical protein [uncultured Paraglaciecola sp.]
MAYIISTGKGPVQPVNADLVTEWQIENGSIYLVCDGVNHNDKTMAAVQYFAKSLINSDWINIDSPDKKVRDNILKVLESMQSEHNGQTFCCCIAIVFEKETILAHCGDCRIGDLTKEGVRWLTKDDVPALNLYNKGHITKEIYAKARHLISTKLKVGANNHNSLTIKKVATLNVERLILCSDGFWSVTEPLLQTNLSNILKSVPTEIRRLEAESEDNFSVVIV